MSVYAEGYAEFAHTFDSALWRDTKGTCHYAAYKYIDNSTPNGVNRKRYFEGV